MKKKVVTKNSKKVPFNNNVIIYQAKSGAIELRGDFSHETVWATQAQIAEVFGIERSVITKHIKNIYKEGELEEKPTCAKIAQVQNEGNRVVTREIEHYNLDIILSGPKPPNPSELIISKRMDQIFAYLKDHYDNIILDYRGLR